MLIYIAQRIGLAILICIAAMTLLFSVIYVIPGDPATIVLGPRAKPEMREALRMEMGLDQPIPVQIVRFFAKTITGDLGTDLFSRRSVAVVVLEALPYTLALIATGLGWAVLLGMPLGCYSAIRRNSFVDKFTGVLSVGTISIPSFVVAIYAMLLFAVHLNWLPAIGAGERGDLLDQLWHLVLPALRRRPRMGRLSRPHRARVDARGHGGEPYPHRPRLRAIRGAHRLPLCAAHRHSADHHLAQSRHRQPTVERRLCREHFRTPWHRQADRRHGASRAIIRSSRAPCWWRLACS